jgi:uncharacterized membrane protein YjjP (DUF1212 family)
VESGTADLTGETASEIVRGASSETELLLRFTRAGHDAGYPTAELEERALALARATGLEEAQISVTPTVIDVSVGALQSQRSYTFRVRPASVDLDALARLDGIVQDVVDERLDADTARKALAEAQAEPLRRPWPLELGAYALAGAALTPVLGGGGREAASAALVGLIVGAVAIAGRRIVRAEPMTAPIAGVAASFSATTLAQLGLDASSDLVTLAALVTFLPGMTLTIGMRELATEHLQSGVANTASALVQLLGLVFGVEIGRSVAVNWLGPVGQVAPEPTFSGWQLLAAIAAGLAFTLTLRARSRDAFVMCAATVLALVANEGGAALFGNQAAAFVAALAIGVVGNLAGAQLRRSPLVFIVPGVLMLVPGSAGYNSVLQLVTDQTISGITAGFDTFVTAISIAYGLMVSTVVLPRRLTRIDRGDDRARAPADSGS